MAGVRRKRHSVFRQPKSPRVGKPADPTVTDHHAQVPTHQPWPPPPPFESVDIRPGTARSSLPRVCACALRCVGARLDVTEFHKSTPPIRKLKRVIARATHHQGGYLHPQRPSLTVERHHHDLGRESSVNRPSTMRFFSLRPGSIMAAKSSMRQTP